MRRKFPSENEFVIEPDGIVHRPTNARFYPFAGEEQLQNAMLGSLGSVLPNGDDYRQDEVEDMAIRLWAARKKVS